MLQTNQKMAYKVHPNTHTPLSLDQNRAQIGLFGPKSVIDALYIVLYLVEKVSR
jgi:hypothetical protein